MKKWTNRKLLSCNCLDFVEASQRHRVYPLMYCHMELEGNLDINRLKRAVLLSSKIVPEILFAYHFQKGCFVDLGHTVDDVVITYVSQVLHLDLSKHPQLQIIISPQQKHDQVVVMMSHILTDGRGFLQYLYLLTALYNDEQVDMNRKNVRDIIPVLQKIHVLAPTEQVKYNRFLFVPPLRSSEKSSRRYCLKTQIPADSMMMIHRKAKKSGATLNDVFMTAYARVIARLKNIGTVVLPCPADLRKFHPELADLTVANMTGMYRKITIEIAHDCSFTSTLQQVHIEMELQKSRYRCFAGVKAFSKVFRKTPRRLLGQVIKATYRLLPVSYTNFGIIDHEKLHFKGCTIQNCFLTGAYRLPPDFQLTISTFKNVCTLNCTLFSSLNDRKKGQHILDQVKQEILNWAEKN